MEHKRRLIWVLEQKLVENIEDDSKSEKGEPPYDTSKAGRFIQQLAQRLCENDKKTHYKKGQMAVNLCLPPGCGQYVLRMCIVLATSRWVGHRKKLG